MIMATCQQESCQADIVEIERYHVSVQWTRKADGTWEMGTFDNGTHFHVFCERGREVRLWSRQLPEDLQRVVYPRISTQSAE
jgi:hypothetical protein